MKSEDLKSAIERGDALELLDVREPDEFEDDKTVPGARNVPMGKVFVEAKKDALPKDKKIVTICKQGGRCEIVARELKKKGYDIEHLEGGLEAWNSVE